MQKEEVDHLLDDQVARFDGQHHLGEETADVDAQGHVGDDLFDDLALPPLVALDVEVAQEVAQFIDLSLARFGEVGIRHGRSDTGRSRSRPSRLLQCAARGRRPTAAHGPADASASASASHGVGPGWIWNGHDSNVCVDKIIELICSAVVCWVGSNETPTAIGMCARF